MTIMSSVTAAILLGTAPAAWAAGAVVPMAKSPSAVPFSPPPPPLPKYVGSLALSLGQEPFFASQLVTALHSLVPRISVHDPQSAAVLRNEILGVGPHAVSPAQLAAEMGKRPLPAGQAAALLVANAAAEPHQFARMIGQLDWMKPGLGMRVSESLRTMGLGVGPVPDAVPYLKSAEYKPLFRGDPAIEKNPLLTSPVFQGKP